MVGIGASAGGLEALTLPLVAAPLAAATSKTVPTAERTAAGEASSINGGGAPLRGLRVLVVDDDAAIRETTTDLLGMLGASVVTMPSAATALKAIEDSRFDVVLCDIAMPEEDGYAFIRHLRQREATHGGATPAIAFGS